GIEQLLRCLLLLTCIISYNLNRGTGGNRRGCCSSSRPLQVKRNILNQCVLPLPIGVNLPSPRNLFRIRFYEYEQSWAKSLKNVLGETCPHAYVRPNEHVGVNYNRPLSR